MPNVGISQITGDPIVGWERTREGLIVCIQTEVGERVQRRDFGGEGERMIDRPQNQDTILDLFVTVQNAIEPRLVNGLWYGEPCFGLRRLRANAATPGKVTVELMGVEYPNGHLGDFTTTGDLLTIAVPLEMGL